MGRTTAGNGERKPLSINDLGAPPARKALLLNALRLARLLLGGIPHANLAWHTACLHRKNKLKKYLDIFRVIDYIKSMKDATQQPTKVTLTTTSDIIALYNAKLADAGNGNLSNQQWYEFNTAILGEIMLDHYKATLDQQ
jgi:hypothetical protein